MNSMIIAEQDRLTMSSKEIAKTTGRQHSKVMQVIIDLSEKGVAKSATPSKTRNAQNGQFYDEFQLNKRDSLVVVARLSPEFTAQIIDRWQELEEGVNLPLRLPDYTLKIKELQEELNSLVAKQDLVDQLKIMEGYKVESIEMSDSTYVFDAYTEQYMKDKVKINWRKIDHTTLGRNIIRVMNNPFSRHKGRGVPLNLAKESIVRVIKKHTK